MFPPCRAGTSPSWTSSRTTPRSSPPTTRVARKLGKARHPAGERLQEHQVHERAWLAVIGGAIEIDDADGGTISGGAGLLAAFDPNERHEVRATEDARLLLVLSPWPGEGHPSQTT